jgi:hypothetical protein
MSALGKLVTQMLVEEGISKGDADIATGCGGGEPSWQSDESQSGLSTC